MKENLPSTRLEQAYTNTNFTYTQRLDLDNSGAEIINLKHYWRVIIKNKKLIIATTLACFLLSLIYAFTATPLYTAQSQIKIGTYQPILTNAKIEDLLQQGSRESNYFDTQVQEITSLSLADQVLRDAKIKSYLTSLSSSGFFSGSKNSSDDIIKEELTNEQINNPVNADSEYQSSYKELKDYLKLVKVSPIRKTSLVNISATLKDPEMSAYMANKHASEYIDWIRFKRMEQQSRGLTFLKMQANELREKVSDLEREMADYAETHSIIALNKDENITVQKMAQLNALLTDATNKRIQYENEYKQAESALETNSAGVDDASVIAMRSELGKLEAERQLLGTKFTPSYPRIQQIDSQIANIQNTIKEQRRQIVEGLKSKALSAKEEEQNLIEELEKQKSQTFDLSKKQVNFNILNRELTASRELLQNILSQIKETSIAVESNTTNVSLVDPAVIPDSPSFPRKRIVVLIGLLGGLGLGLGLAFLINYFDNSVRSIDDLTDAVAVPTLGMIPTFELFPANEKKLLGDSHGKDKVDERHVTTKEDGIPDFIKNPKSIASESYRSIRTALLLSQADTPPKKLLVTSSQASEGKTTTSLNLAASFASTGRKVIIIDADLRKPKLHKKLGLDGEHNGLAEVLAGLKNIDDVVINDLIPNVTVMLSGTIPPNPSELLGSQSMEKMLNELAEKYDHVIVDSPPVLPVTDAVVLSRYVDGVAIVVRAGVTPKRVVQDATAKLSYVGAKILGCILNDVDTKKGEYKYYARYYNSYYTDDNASDSRAA
jgi:succinoglycan biosynthesis transport protein ExoP